MFVVGVVGPSGSGKTTVCHELAKLLGADCDCVIGEDDYHKSDLLPGQSYLDRDPRVETPESVDWTKLFADVASAKQRLLRKSAEANGKVHAKNECAKDFPLIRLSSVECRSLRRRHMHVAICRCASDLG